MRILFTLLLLLPQLAKAQGDTLYYTKSRALVPKEKAYFYSVPPVKEGDKYKMQMFYLNGTPMLEGLNSTPDYGVRDGYYTFYHENGKRSSYGNYANNVKVGQWKERYSDTDKLWLVTTYNYTSDTVKILSSYYRSGKLKRQEYITAKADTGVCYSEAGAVIPFTRFYQLPEEKTAHSVYKFIAEHMTYPVPAREAGIQGKVDVMFVVTKTGNVESVSANFEDPDLAKEAVRVVKLTSGLWVPGLVDDEPDDVLNTLPVSFRLED